MTLVEQVKNRPIPIPAPLCRQIRLDAHVTQLQLARELDIDQSTIARYELGARPRADIADAYYTLLRRLQEAS